MPVVEASESIEQKTFGGTLDLLDRQPFVDQLINIANMLADKKETVCYAIN